MNTLVSITVTVNDGTQNRTFDVDIANQCALVWRSEGWDLLADYYDKVKHDPAKAKEVKDRTCPKAKPKPGTMLATTDAADPVFALKDICCDPTQWP